MHTASNSALPVHRSVGAKSLEVESGTQPGITRVDAGSCCIFFYSSIDSALARGLVNLSYQELRDSPS